ncbi:MAG: hypothetical protein KAR81_06115 [Sulfurimonas sp.]|nr:hypothetical protein [Sulfurimonas sp.]
MIIRIFIFIIITFIFTSCTVKKVTMYRTSPYSVIVNSNSQIDSIDKSQLRDLFLRKNSYINKQKIIPVNLLADNSARKAFESSILNMDRATLNTYWTSQYLKDIRPPLSKKSYNAVLIFVLNVDGAIGYIPSNMVDNRVRVINEF